MNRSRILTFSIFCLAGLSVVLVIIMYNIIISLFYLTILLICFFFFFQFVKKPLSLIVDALNANSPERLIILGLQQNEFGKISRFLMEFFHQRKLIHDKLIELNKANEEMEKLNNELSKKQESLISANIEIQSQKVAIENRNIEINESIAYSSIIQTAALSIPESFNIAFPENFIFFKPRNILSGDFYWIKENKGLYYIVGADCTGHGLAGALLSMMGISFLDNILYSNESFSASDILNSLRKRMIHALDQKGEFGEAHGGMDLVLCVIDPKNMKLEFSGAYNPLYIVRSPREDKDKELEEIKGNNMPIGLHLNSEPFTSTVVKLNNNDMIYILTDGFGDQFGGPLNKKYNTKRLKNFLLSIASDNVQKQYSMIKEEFESWSNGNEQTDDILLMGIRIIANKSR